MITLYKQDIEELAKAREVLESLPGMLDNTTACGEAWEIIVKNLNKLVLIYELDQNFKTLSTAIKETFPK
jgi:hypothetical protein